MTQKKGILVAGTLTGLILLTLLALGFTNTAALVNQDNQQTGQPVVQVVQPTQSSEDVSQIDIQALQNHAAELELALQTMQVREAQYQQQLEAANQTIIGMERPAQPSLGSLLNGGHFEHEEHEHDDD